MKSVYRLRDGQEKAIFSAAMIHTMLKPVNPDHAQSTITLRSVDVANLESTAEFLAAIAKHYPNETLYQHAELESEATND